MQISNSLTKTIRFLISFSAYIKRTYLVRMHEATSNPNLAVGSNENLPILKKVNNKVTYPRTARGRI